jgi:hypothetical protein|tara:strand:+ start:619 stop:1557 length:939 start_codon:yes stop_codon:yes gene_type:complete
MSLKIRKHYLKKLSKKFQGKKINDLMYEIKIPENLFYNIKSATINYVSKSFNDNETIVDEKKLIKKILSKKKILSNLTPNGIIVPKIESSLEFNSLLKSYVQILKYFNIESLIENFHFPPNIRLKLPYIKKNHMLRKHPTELMHSDTWTGANPNWCAVHLFILGDIARNNIRYAEPPSDFDEDWLKPLKKSQLGKDISSKFKLMRYIPKKGHMIIADATIIHQSFRKKKAGIRISLDTGFDLKMKKLTSFNKTKVDTLDIKKIRKNETISKEDFIQLGKKTYFHFPDSFKNKVFHKGGFKHPTNPKLIRLQK